jgi:hypothetical protein
MGVSGSWYTEKAKVTGIRQPAVCFVDDSYMETCCTVAPSRIGMQGLRTYGRCKGERCRISRIEGLRMQG